MTPYKILDLLLIYPNISTLYIFINKLSFFIPKYVFLLIGKRLEILSYEPKDKVDLFFSSLFVGEFTNKFQINLKNRESKKKYLDKIVKIKEHIQRGDIYEMNYCTEFFAEKDSLDCESLFLNLNTIAKTPFSAFLKINEHTIISASPERFIKKKGNNLISQPIKGTINRGRGFDEDQAFAKKLKNSKKDISENIMITDLVRNDLSITALKNSVKVDELCEVYTFKKVHQMISTISSKVDNKLCFIELLKSVFPMGSMTGAPKLKAMELIEEYEEFKRGIFSGSLGYIMPNGDFDFNVIIRTILYNSYTKNLSVGVGGAITINSNPEKEYEECLVKLKPVLELLD